MPHWEGKIYSDYILTISKNKPRIGYTYIYTLSDPETNEVRYVGKTIQSLYSRYFSHLALRHLKVSTRLRNWIVHLFNNNKYPIIQLIDEVKNDIWIEEEIFYISYFRYLGFNLVNHTEGGDNGTFGARWTLSKEIKDKLKASRSNPIKLFLYNTKGLLVREFNNFSEASSFLEIRLRTLHNLQRKCNLINRKYFLLREGEIFSSKYLKRKYRDIKITNIKNNSTIIFKYMKDCCEYLNISSNTFRKLVDTEQISNNFKIEKI